MSFKDECFAAYLKSGPNLVAMQAVILICTIYGAVFKTKVITLVNHKSPENPMN